MVELHEVVVVVDLVPRLLDVPLQDVVAHGVLVGGVEEMLEGRGEVVGASRGVVGFHGGDSEGLTVGLHDGGDPLNHLPSLIEPHLDDALVYAARGVARQLVQQLHLVNWLGHVQAVLRVDGAQVLAGVSDARALLGHDEVESEVTGGAGGHHARVARPDDEEVGVAGGDDVGVGYRRLLAEPVGVCLAGCGFGMRGFLGARGAAGKRAGCKRSGAGHHAGLQEAAAGEPG